MAETAERILKNSVTIMISESLVRFLSFIFTIYAARKLGVVEFGYYSLAVNFVLIFAVLYDGGLRSLIVREVSRNRQDAKKYYHNLLAVKLFLGIGGYSLIIITTYLMGYSKSLNILFALIAIQYFFNSVDDFHMAFFNAFEMRKYEAYIKVTQKFLFISVGFIVLSVYQDLHLFILCSLATGFFTNLFGYFLIRKISIKPKLAWDSEFIREQLREAWPFGLSSIAIGLYFYVDSILLSKLSTEDAVGYYNSAYRILEGTLIIPFAIMGSINPVISRLFVESFEKMKRVYHFSLKIMFTIGLPIAICGTILSKKIILFLFGPNYEPASTALAILVWAVMIIFLNTVLSTTLNAMNRQRTWLMILLSAATINIGLNVFFIPKYSYFAASAITLLTELFVFLMILHQLKKMIGRSLILANYWRIIISGLTIGAIVFLIQDLPVFLVILISIILYPIITIFMKVWSSSDIEILINTIFKKVDETKKKLIIKWIIN